MANQKFMVKVLAVCVGMAVVVSAKSAVIFQDDFNRADGSVGNGWLNDTDSSFPDLVMRDNVLPPSLGETVTGISNAPLHIIK